jgi:hypothetical protein
MRVPRTHPVEDGSESSPDRLTSETELSDTESGGRAAENRAREGIIAKSGLQKNERPQPGSER